MKKYTIVLMLCLLTAIPAFSGGRAEEAAAVAQDTLRVGVAALPNNLDPSTGVAVSNTQIYFNIYDMLLFSDPFDDFTMKSYIVETWDRVNDYTAEFRLKEGVTFHNGDPVTSEDVKFTIDRIVNGDPGYVGATLSAIIATVEGVEIVDQRTFRVVSRVPDEVIFSRLSSTLGVYVVPKAYIEEVGNEVFGQRPIGTGPYMVDSFTPDRLVLRRYDGYYGEPAAYERVEYRLYQEVSTRAAALIAGDLDIILQVTPDLIGTIEREPGLTTGTENMTLFHMLRFNTSAGPLADRMFRQALSLGIDRQRLIDAFWLGASTIPRGYNFPEYGDYYVPDYPLYEYDPDRAREMVANSAYNGEEITYELMPGYYEYANEVAEAVVDMWGEIGVNARVVYKEQINNNLIDYVGNWSNGIRFTEPLGGLWLLWGADTTFPQRMWRDMPQEFIDAGRILESSMDFEERYAMNRKLMTIWDEEVPGTILYRVAESWALREDINWVGRPSNRVVSFRAEHLTR